MDKVIRVAAGEEAAGWRDALSAPGALDGAKVLKEDEGSWVRRATVMGRDVVVKCRVLNTLGRRVKHWVGMGHGHKHWRGAELLAKSNIRTGAPMALIAAVVDGKPCELLVLEYVEGRSLLDCMAASKRGEFPARTEHEIARAVGAHFAKFGQAIHNRDHKPSNLIVFENEKQDLEIAVIDCVAVVRPRMWRVPAEVLLPLALEPSGCGVVPRRSLIARAMREYASGMPILKNERSKKGFIRSVWVDVAIGVIEHGDPRPRVDPLAKR